MQEMATAGAVLAAVGLGFELAIVPSHLATLAIVRSAPVGGVGFATLVSKVGAAFAMAKLAAAHPALQPILVWLGVATIVWAALGGLGQRAARGLIAYSAIGHAGSSRWPLRAAARRRLPYYAIVYLCSAALVLAGWNGDEHAGADAGRESAADEIARAPLHGLRRAAWVVGVVVAGRHSAQHPASLRRSPCCATRGAVARHDRDRRSPPSRAVVGPCFYLRPVPETARGAAYLRHRRCRLPHAWRSRWAARPASSARLRQRSRSAHADRTASAAPASGQCSDDDSGDRCGQIGSERPAQERLQAEPREVAAAFGRERAMPPICMPTSRSFAKPQIAMLRIKSPSRSRSARSCP
jgi:hypothetical protein